MTRDEKRREVAKYLEEEFYGMDPEDAEACAYDILCITEDHMLKVEVRD